MRLSETIKVTQFEAGFVVSSGLERKVKITRQPINNDLEYLYSLKLRIENYQVNGKKRTLHFKIDSLNPGLKFSFKLEGRAFERIWANVELREIIQRKDLTLGEDIPKIKAFLDEVGVGIKDGYIELKKRATLNTPREDVVSLEETKDKVVLNCYKPPETIRPVYGTWCLACCAICPLPTGLTYTHLKSGII